VYLAPLVLLYNSQISGNCYKVRLLFAHLGIEYEIQELDVVDRSNRSEVLGALNPALRVPTLVLDDGRSLGESDAILYYFADGTEYLPEDRWERAKALQWMFFEQYSHEPNIAVARMRQIYGIEVSDEEREARQRGGEAALQAMEGHLNDYPFLVGDRYTIADIALYAYTHVAPEGGFELEPYPAIRAWLRRVATQPGHVPITV
jgi:glutathione S-transferase